MLGEQLEQRRVGNRNLKVFVDVWDIDFGTSIISAIEEGLKESRYVGLVLSPDMVRADWPTAEWQSQIMDDPLNKRGRVLPLLFRRFDSDGAPIEMPFILKGLKRFDFSQAKNFESELDKLIRKLSGLPPLRGAIPKRGGRLGAALGQAPRELGQEAPDTIEESLTSNLLPVIEPPNFVYSDETSVERKQEVWNKVKGTTPPFFLMRGRLYSYVPHGSRPNPFGPFLVGREPKAEPFADLLAKQDEARQLIGNLNAGLRQHCYDMDIWTAKTDRGLFYPPVLKDGRARTFTWGKGRRPRTIAVMKTRSKQEGEFGVHMAARMRFILLDGKLYLLIDPAWMFTVDGVKPVEGVEMGVFSTKWGGRERNAALLRNVLMWGLLIAKGAREIRINMGAKGQPIATRIQSVPAHTRIGSGIFGDALRLDGILRGEGAGEQEPEPDRQELDRIAALALAGESGDEEEIEEPVDEQEDDDTDEPELF